MTILALISLLFSIVYVLGYEGPSISFFKSLRKQAIVAASVVGISIADPNLPIAHASREIANIPTSGIIFKDSLKVNAFDDPKVPGVVLYLSDFDRPITEKLAKDFFNDPSSSSLTCVKAGPIKLSSDIYLGSDGEEVFEESKNLFFKVS
jgi:catabolite regulation protein CreA